ncbi:MAG: hypothetical protein ACREMA_08650 [Longimicrobiales bacterium]
MKSWSAAVAVLLVAACASAPGGTTSVVNVHVQNDLIPPGPVTVYLVPESGIERMLGTISSGPRTLQYTGLPPVGTQRLVARTSNGRNIISSAFVIDGVVALEWSLASNLVRITETRGS